MQLILEAQKPAVDLVLSPYQEISARHQPSHQIIHSTTQTQGWELLYLVVFIGLRIYPACVPLGIYDLRVQSNPSVFEKTVAKEIVLIEGVTGCK